MRISGEELGKLLIAFGKALIQPDDTIQESTPSTVPTQPEVVSGSFETTSPEQLPLDSTVFAEANEDLANKARIEELSQELAKLQSTQNQSGLNLKPIKL